MGDAAIAGPSFLLARHDIAHREHLHHHQQHHVPKRQADPDTATAVVTVVAATVSVIQQIDVDVNGNTFSVLLVPAAPTEGTAPSLTDTLPATTPPSISIVSSGASLASIPTSTLSSTASGQSLLSLSSSLSTTSASTSTPSTPSSFASLIASSNSTTLISSASSLNHANPAFSNSTHSTSTSASSRSSLTYLTSSGSSTHRSSQTEPSTSSFYSPTSSFDPTATSTTSSNGAFIAGGGTGVASDTASSSTSTSGATSGSQDGPATPTPVIIGSVVSSIAGVAIIVFAIMFLWRWKKRNQTMLQLGSGALGSGAPGGGPNAITEGPSQPSGGMTDRRSMIQAVPAALASLTGYRRSSQKTERTVSSTAGSERGFYRVSGRKLPSVLQTGGDGYGGVIDNRNANTLSGTSFYRDSTGFYGGPGSGSPSTSPLGMPTQRDSGIPVMRPSPARTPVTETGPFFPMPPPPPTPPVPRPDVLGRSHPSRDGSHTSRFTEEV